MSEPEILLRLEQMTAEIAELRATMIPAPPVAKPQLISIKAAARLLGLHERTVRRNVDALGAVKIGGVWRLDASKLGPSL